MKHFKLFAAIALMLVINIQCSDDDNNNSQRISGMWSLMQSTGTIAGIEHNFVEGTIVYTFSTNGTVTVLNNNEDETLQDGLPSGTYNYTIGNTPADESSLSGCSKFINIGTAEFNCFILGGTTMQIREGVADGITYHFNKIDPDTTNF